MLRERGQISSNHTTFHENLDRFQIWSNIIQHVATYRNRVAKRMQHVVPNNVAKCCVEMLRAFGQAFTENVTQGTEFEFCVVASTPHLLIQFLESCASY